MSGPTMSGLSVDDGIKNEVSEIFEQALEDFKKGLRPKDLERFKHTTIGDLKRDLEEIQKAQSSKRRLQAAVRLKPTLEAVTQLGKVIEVFANSSEYVAFVWGPLKFLLQTASTFADAFTELLNVYQELGEKLPVVMDFERQFRTEPGMGRVMGYLYKDILEFHSRALNYFQQPMWRQLFQAVWNTQRTRFRVIIEDIQRHSALVKDQGDLLAIRASEIQWRHAHASLRTIHMKQQQQHGRELISWLRPVPVEEDQRYFAETRKRYPGTGIWLLENATFKSWSQPSCEVIPPLLWLNGLPGAGKTILASQVVDMLRDMSPKPTVLYFYCKYGDKDRNNFLSLCRSLLAQLLETNKDILIPFFNHSFSNSMEVVLNSRAKVQELLELAIRNCPSVYIVIDGIDECQREERQDISRWFRQIVEEVPENTNPDQVRCLFVSQDDGVARKDFSAITWLKIRREDSKKDIEKFSATEAKRIREKFDLSDQQQQEVATKIQTAADGMFLLAKLISINLHGQTNLQGLEHELHPDRFPKAISDAYSRIMERISQQASEAEKVDSRLILSWLVCAKRSLKWHEIQGMKSIDLESSSVDFPRRKFRIDHKDLCGSLVEIKPDNTVDLVHTTAKIFLLESKYVNKRQTEFELAGLCVNCLNFKGLTRQTLGMIDSRELEKLIMAGHYAFMDYAILYWIHHAELALGIITEDHDCPEVDELSESLRVFLDLHYIKLAKPLKIPPRITDLLQPFKLKGMSRYDDLEQAITSMRKQLRFFGEPRPTELAIDLSEVVGRVRESVEKRILKAKKTDGPEGLEALEALEGFYGRSLYKCPRLSCKFFTNGFDSKTQRDAHLDKHNRSHMCTVMGCPGNGILGGFSSERDLTRHMNEAHCVTVGKDDGNEFPNDERWLLSDVSKAQPPGTPAISATSGENGEAIPQLNDVLRQLASAHSQPDDREKKVITYTCIDCPRKFDKLFNYKSHRVTHGVQLGEKSSWKCKVCGKAFRRKGDCTRHEQSHDPSKRFPCEGCGQVFTRKDTLKSHHKSGKGSHCLQDQSPPTSCEEDTSQHQSHERSNGQEHVIKAALELGLPRPDPRGVARETGTDGVFEARARGAEH